MFRILIGTHNGALNAGGVGKNRDSRRISGYRCSANNNSDGRPCSLPHRPPRISESLFTTTVYGRPRRREHNNIYSYAAVNPKRTNNRTIEATYWQTRSIARRPGCDSRAIVNSTMPSGVIERDCMLTGRFIHIISRIVRHTNEHRDSVIPLLSADTVSVHEIRCWSSHSV